MRSQTTLLSRLLCLHQLFRASLAGKKTVLGLGLAAVCQESDDIRLLHHAGLWVGSSHISLPVWVVSEVSCWDSDGVIVCLWLKGSWGRVAELGVQRDTGRTSRVDGKSPSDSLPYAVGLYSVFLNRVSPVIERRENKAFEGDISIMLVL